MNYKNDNPTLPSPLLKGRVGMGLLIAYCLLLTALFALPSCDSASASPYEQMYNQQLIVTDSLQAEIGLIGERLEQIHTTSINKIDSLKNIVAQKNILIARQDSIIQYHDAYVDTMFQSIQAGLEKLSEQALQNLINIQKR